MALRVAAGRRRAGEERCAQSVAASALMWPAASTISTRCHWSCGPQLSCPLPFFHESQVEKPGEDLVNLRYRPIRYQLVPLGARNSVSRQPRSRRHMDRIQLWPLEVPSNGTTWFRKQTTAGDRTRKNPRKAQRQRKGAPMIFFPLRKVYCWSVPAEQTRFSHRRGSTNSVKTR